jgi:uncharacterized protein (UPF0276 family)
LWTKGTASSALPRGSPLELRELETLPQRKITHGVGYPIGGTICDQKRHVEEFRHWTERLLSPWTSEHLSILEVAGEGGPQACGFLMPPLQTDAEVALATANIRHRAAAIGRPFAFETGVNYFTPRPSEMADGDFFAAVAESADCGILLDLNNLWVNAKNGRAEISDVLAKLPLERVWELHLAGAEFAHGHWLDAHSGAIDPELAMIAADVVGDLPNLGAIIFEIARDRAPNFGIAKFLKEMETLNFLWERTRPTPAVLAPVRLGVPTKNIAGLTPAAWERLIAIRMLPEGHRPSTASEQLTAPDERSFELYARLATSFRFGAIADLLKNSIRLLLLAIGEAALRELLDSYTAYTPPTAFPSDEALGFKRFVDAKGLSIPGLREILLFEASSIEAAVDSRTIRITLTRDLGTLLGDIAAGRIPEPSSDDLAVILEIGVDPKPFVRLIESLTSFNLT